MKIVSPLNFSLVEKEKSNKKIRGKREGKVKWKVGDSVSPMAREHKVNRYQAYPPIHRV